MYNRIRGCEVWASWVWEGTKKTQIVKNKKQNKKENMKLGEFLEKTHKEE